MTRTATTDRRKIKFCPPHHVLPKQADKGDVANDCMQTTRGEAALRSLARLLGRATAREWLAGLTGPNDIIRHYSSERHVDNVDVTIVAAARATTTLQTLMEAAAYCATKRDFAAAQRRIAATTEVGQAHDALGQ